MAEYRYSTGGYQANEGSSNPGREREREAEFQRLLKTVSSNIQKISQNVSTIQRLVHQIGTPKDSDDIREKLHETQHYTHQLTKDTNHSLQELNKIPAPGNASEQRQRKMQKERVVSELTAALNQFQAVQRSAAAKEKDSIKRARAHSGATSHPTPFGDFGNSGDEQLISFDSTGRSKQQGTTSGGMGASQDQVLMMEEDVGLEELQERENAIRKLEADIVDVNQIFKDLGMMVHEQGEMIDSIEAHVETAAIQVEEGTQQLSKAKNYQTKARRKMVILVVVLLILAAIIGLIIWLSVKK